MADDYTLKLNNKTVEKHLEHLDAMNLHTRNCTLDSVAIARNKIKAGGADVDAVFDELVDQVKFHFRWQRDNQSTFVSAVLHGLNVRRFTDGG